MGGADELYHGYRWHLNNEQPNNIIYYAKPLHIIGLLGIENCDGGKLIKPSNDIDELFIRDYLPRWLNRADITGMRYSIENRVPFLSIKNFCYTKDLPIEQKTNNARESKYLLKMHLRNTLPNKFIDRKKRGFDYPLNKWCLPNLIDYLENQREINQTYLRKIKKEFEKTNDYYIPRAIFVVSCFLMWKQVNIPRPQGSTQ